MSSKNRYSGWDDKRGIIRSRKGGWRIGKAIYNHGYSMMDDLVGKKSFMQVLVLNITGNLPERALADWLEACFICTSWPDPRIWCNTMGALGGTSRTSPVAAVAAGLLASDSHMYGPGVIRACCEFIDKAFAQVPDLSPELIIQSALAQRQSKDPGRKPVIAGYARPIANGDERVIAMREVSRELGFSCGPRETLAMQLNDVLVRDYDEGINIGGYLAAFLRDNNLQTDAICRIYSTCVSSGIHACYAEAADNPAGYFLPMRCDDVAYVGAEPRRVPTRD